MKVEIAAVQCVCVKVCEYFMRKNFARAIGFHFYQILATSIIHLSTGNEIRLTALSLSTLWLEAFIK